MDTPGESPPSSPTPLAGLSDWGPQGQDPTLTFNLLRSELNLKGDAKDASEGGARPHLVTL